ncbi:hypothetical protein NEOC95_001167 [Neochlamydia sp. AcF95]|nr:hypothetical protein [Neochlamydia sp. AcF95]
MLENQNFLRLNTFKQLKRAEEMDRIFLRYYLLMLFALSLYTPALSASQLQLVATESHPEAFIQNKNICH